MLDRQKVEKIVQRVAHVFSKEGNSREKKVPENLELEYVTRRSTPPFFLIDKPLAVQVWANPIRLRNAFDYELYKTFKDNRNPDATPKLSIEQVIEKARQYLSEFDIQLNDDLRLDVVNFNQDYTACWVVRWHREYGGFLWNDEDVYHESVFVIFHETFGLISIGESIYSPLPKSIDVKIGRPDAIAKASKCVPLVQRTPSYQQARRDGFVAVGLKSCELRIAVPNWLLDPERAIWMPEKPPEETRLCWIVRFITVDSKASERELKDKDGKPAKLTPPEIWIYIDAATGEVVGADFS